jgi:hypothetical protein
MISHDALAVMWEAETLNWLKSFKCPIAGWDDRTWYDRIIKIGGKWNDEVDKSYQNKLPGDSPELMPNDNHLNADVKEGASHNVALTYFWKMMILTNTVLEHQHMQKVQYIVQ